MTPPLLYLSDPRVFQGPCDYNPKLEPRYHLEMPGSAPFLSGVPKGDKKRQAGPGPGQYVAHHSPLGANISASNVPHLGSSAQRGAWLRSDQVRFDQHATYTEMKMGALLLAGRPTERLALEVSEQQAPTLQLCQDSRTKV